MIDVALIGAYGSAGAAVANELAGHPEIRLRMIDDGDPGGGLCILRGCMPSKAVLSAGAHKFQARADDRLAGTPTVDVQRTIERKNDRIDGFARHRRSGIQELTDHDGVTLHRETARFVDDRTIAVGEQTITPDYIVIATGSTINVPPIPGIDDVSYQTSAEILDQTTFPDSGVAIGFGVIGLELVPYLSEVGDVDLTVLEQLPGALQNADPEYGELLADYYREEFDVDINFDVATTNIDETADGVRVETAERGTFDAEELYLFTGRKPNLAGLNLDQTAIDPGPGWVADTMQTTADPQVFVVGDANGRQPILHIAKEQGQVAAQNILASANNDDLTTYEPTTHQVIFSGLGILPFARVGHTKASASELDRPVVTATNTARSEGVFQVKDVPDGQATLVVDATDGTVLGYEGLHYHADVMAKTMQLAVEMGLDVREIPDRAYHPTTPEILDGLLRETRANLE